MRILVIDDDEDFVNTLVTVLRREGVDAHGAVTLDSIKPAVRRTDYDLALLDILLPGPDVPSWIGGQRVLVDIMTYRPDAKVVLLSGGARGEQIVDLLKLGAVDFLEKPATLDEHRVLVDRLRARLAGPNVVHDREALRENHIALLWNYATSRTRVDRGPLLEQLLYHLFVSIPGFTSARLNFRDGPYEIDLLVTNGHPESFWSRRGDFILVECKNLGGGGRVKRDALDIIIRKVSWIKGARLAFVVSPSGFSAGFLRILQHELRSKEHEIVCLDGKRLESLITCGRVQRASLLQSYVENPVP